MDLKFNSILSVILIPQIVNLIVEKNGFNDVSAINTFYNSKVSELLAKEETKMWHYSPLTLYMMYKEEKENGNIIFPDG